MSIYTDKLIKLEQQFTSASKCDEVVVSILDEVLAYYTHDPSLVSRRKFELLDYQVEQLSSFTAQTIIDTFRKYNFNCCLTSLQIYSIPEKRISITW